MAMRATNKFPPFTIPLKHVEALQTADAMNAKLTKADDTCTHLTVELVRGPGSDDRYFIKWGSLTLFDSIDHNWEPEDETLEQYLWDELADMADTWQALTRVIRRNQTKATN